MFYGGLIVCLYIGLSTKFRVDWRLRRQALMFGALMFCVLSVFALYRDWETDRKSTRLNSSHSRASRMPSSA